MNLNQLEYFVSVAESLNFTRAAAKCFISQTAMTQQIRSLEKMVGVDLFIRDKHHVELTAAGRVYLHEARIILDRSNDAIRLARMTSEGVQGKINIGYINGFGQSDFVGIIKNYHVAYPNIEIKFTRNNMSILLDAVINKECDMAFAIHTDRDYPELERRYIKSYPVLAVLPRSHALADRKALGYQDLKDEDFIMMQPKTRPKDQMEESMLIYGRGGYLPNVAAVEGEQETLMVMVAMGMGIAIMPEYILRHYKAGEDFAFLPMVKEDGTAESLDMEVYWRRENDNPAVERLQEMLWH